jgi:hypothetical protein
MGDGTARRRRRGNVPDGHVHPGGRVRRRRDQDIEYDEMVQRGIDDARELTDQAVIDAAFRDILNHDFYSFAVRECERRGLLAQEHRLAA